MYKSVAIRKKTRWVRKRRSERASDGRRIFWFREEGFDKGDDVDGGWSSQSPSFASRFPPNSATQGRSIFQAQMVNNNYLQGFAWIPPKYMQNHFLLVMIASLIFECIWIKRLLRDSNILGFIFELQGKKNCLNEIDPRKSTERMVFYFILFFVYFLIEKDCILCNWSSEISV